MSEPNYVCIHDPDAPSVHGKWYDLTAWHMEKPRQIDAKPKGVTEDVTYTPTGMIDVRDDGAVAEIYMRRRRQA